MPDERDRARSDSAQKRHAGEHIDDALVELIRMPVVQPQTGHVPAQPIGKAAVETVRGTLKAADRAADVDHRARSRRAGMQDGADLAARRRQHDTHIAVWLRVRRDALDRKFEIIVAREVIGRWLHRSQRTAPHESADARSYGLVASNSGDVSFVAGRLNAMRIILYTGKGGVGKTSVAAATALRASQ